MDSTFPPLPIAAADEAGGRGAARRLAFLCAARQVFLEQGYEAASINEIVRRAGGSLTTLYAQFGSKEGLFLAVLQAQHEHVAQSMLPADWSHLPLEQGLQRIGEQFLRVLLSSDSLAFFRIIVGESRNHPALLQQFISSAADRLRGMIADYLRKADPAIDEPDIAAGYFLELIRGRHHYRALADARYALSDAAIVEHVERAVRFLLRGIGRR